MRTTRRWTTYDEEYLLDNYGSMKMTTLCKKLDRTEKAIELRLQYLNESLSIKESTSLLDSSYILELLGISDRTLHKWVVDYQFPYTRLSANKNGLRYYDSEKVFEWILLNKNKVVFSKCATGVLVDEPEWFIKLVTRESKSNRNNNGWTVTELKKMIELDMIKESLKTMSIQLKRSNSSIRSKLCRMRKNGDYDYYKEVLLNNLKKYRIKVVILWIGNCTILMVNS